ncbi:uncharacterized protein [Littorina saxatilis]
MRTMIAAYSTRIDVTEPNSNVFYHVYNTSDSVRLNSLTSLIGSTFTANIALVVTYDRVQQRDTNINEDGSSRSKRSVSDGSSPGESSFQTAIVSDGDVTYCVFVYLEGRMNWEESSSPIELGIADGSGKLINEGIKIYSGKRSAYRMDQVIGNTGRKGIWVFEIGRRPPSPEQQCVKWFFWNYYTYAWGLARFRFSLPTCPCTLRGAWRSSLTRLTFNRYLRSRTVVCYVASRANSWYIYPYNQECCYYFGSLIRTPPYAGSALAYNPLYRNTRPWHFIEDRKAHSDCCLKSFSSYYCYLYHLLRPISQRCQRRWSFRRAWFWGDPHITTLDERQYTFNGLGEYTLISIETVNVTFTFQGRTGLAETENGSLSKATVFTAFGLEENGTRVSVELERTAKTSMVIYGDGRDFTSEFNAKIDFAEETTTYTLRRSNDSVVVAFPSGISITISIGIKSLDMSLGMPTEFRGQTKGLMGNFNGNKDDEFILPDSTVLDNDLMTERKIYEDFGKKWAITADNSIMRYETRESTADFANPEFVPIFLDEQPADVKQEAETLCGGADKLACIYDFVATGNKAFALNTQQTDVSAVAVRAELANNQPGLDAPSIINAEAGKSVTISVMGTDDEGDILTYKLFNASDNQSINESNGTITATFDANDPRPINVFVTDSKGAQSIPVTIPVKLCTGCSNHGTCNYERTTRTGDSFDFAIATCDCAPAYTGSNCETELDACPAGNNPCPDDLDCVDLTADEQGDALKGYICNGTCPTGFIFDNDACLDINECANASKCTNGACVNTAGSYVCSCDAGYRLGSDGITCRDVNECAEKSSGCEQKCENKEGSFNCSCEPGNMLQDDGKSCTVTEVACGQNCSGIGRSCKAADTPLGYECFCKQGYAGAPLKNCGNIDECEEGVCDQDCEDTEGSFQCSCYPGFKLNADKRTCSQCTGLSYGAECNNTCECNGRGVACHHVTGCQCQSGWKGEACGDDVDECEENPDVCGQGQLCSNTNGSFVCSCLPGFSKDSAGTCQDVDECDDESGLNTCGEIEVCNNFAGNFSCTCRNGYKMVTGNCKDVDECENNNGGCQQKCQNVVGSYNCECLFGYRLKSDRTSCTQVEDVCKKEANLVCQHGCTLQADDTAVCFCNSGYRLATDKQACQDIDECAASPKPCSDNCTNTVGSFSCSCPTGKKLDNDKLTCIDCPKGSYGDGCSSTCNCGIGSERCNAVTGCVCKSGWEGGTCERDVNECDVEATQTECGVTGSQCVNFQGGYRCQCDSGYEREGEGNCTDIDECDTSPCSQTCENSPGSYRCLCREGFTANGTDCNDIDECESTATNPCTQACDNQPGSYKCFCDQAGYQLNDDGKTCSAQAGCTNTTDCDATNGGCSKTGVTEKCFCNNGYELQANKSCTVKVVDWCASNPCEQTCAKTSDGRSFTCSCESGFILNDDGKTCRVCAEGTFGKDCNKNCTCDTAKTVTCLSNNGTCQCKPGWKGTTCDVNVNECNDSSPCSSNAACTDTEGSFICKCNAGYSKNINGVCEDIDECKQDDDGCGQICNNTAGSFTCDCNTGYNLNADNKTCDDINECTDGSAGCGDTCINSPGSFTCSCKDGYKLKADSKTCEDIDECTDKTDGCQQVCNNTLGSFSCSCNSGLTLTTDGKTCKESVSVRFTVRINIAVSFDLGNQTSSQYISLREEFRQKMFNYLKDTVRALIAVFISNMRRGSVVADVTAAVEKDTSERSASQLTSALRTLDRGLVFTLNNQSGTADATTTDGKSFSQVGVCEAFNSIHTCVNGSQCVEENGSASCTPAEPSDSDSDDWKIILGVCLGIPLAVIIAVNIFCLVRYKRRRTEKANLDEDVSESGSGPNLANWFSLPGASMFPADGKKAAWNYNESISSMPEHLRNEHRFYRNLASDKEFTIKRPQVSL